MTSLVNEDLHDKRVNRHTIFRQVALVQRRANPEWIQSSRTRIRHSRLVLFVSATTFTPYSKRRRTIPEVDAEIQKVDLARGDLVDVLHQVLLAHLVWNIFNHDGRSRIKPIYNALHVELVLRGAL